MDAIALRQVERRQGDFTLGPLDSNVPRGAVLAFVGPNGADNKYDSVVNITMIPLNTAAVSAPVAIATVAPTSVSDTKPAN
jgi:ABC-type cobalamin transport system ATPase subunit